MTRSLLLAGALALGLVSAAQAQPLPPSEPAGPSMQTLPTPDFVVAAAQSDQFEIQEGRLASMRSTNAHVREAGAMMVHDHGASTAKMKMAAHRAGLPPMPPPGLDVGQQQMFARLQATTGPAFDHLYVDQQVQAHRKTLAVVTAYVQGAAPGPIRRAAAQIRPVVEKHLAMFEHMQTMMR
jgi:putative membrane protein